MTYHNDCNILPDIILGLQAPCMNICKNSIQLGVGIARYGNFLLCLVYPFDDPLFKHIDD